MHHELRSYDIVPGQEAAFHARFRDHTLRLFARHGFTVLALWQAEAGRRMLYLLAWPDDATREAAWTAMTGDPEWLEIKRRTTAEQGEMVAAMGGTVLRPLDYGPRL